MSDKEHQVGETLSKAIADLPENKKQYFIGFAEGVAAMAEQVRNAPAEQTEGV